MKKAFKRLSTKLPAIYQLWVAIYSKKAFHVIGSGSSEKGIAVEQNSLAVFCNSATSYIKDFDESVYIATISDNMLMSDLELSELEKIRQKPVDHLRDKNREFSNLSPYILILLSSNVYIKSRLELHKRLSERNIKPKMTIVFSRFELFLIEKICIFKKILSVRFKDGARFLSYKKKCSTGVRSVLLLRILRKSVVTTGIAEMTNSITIGNKIYTSNIFLSHMDIDKFITHN